MNPLETSVARKRKKSKGRKKRRKDEKAAASPEASADDTSVPAADDEDASPSEDASSSEDDAEEDAPADMPDADTLEGEPAVAAVIEVDDDLDDPDARAELIAAAARSAADEGSDAVDEEAQATDDEPSDEAETPEEADEASGEDEDEGASSVEAGDDGEPAGEGEDEDGEEDETPLIGRDALIALSQFRDEGVATVPEELVLDLGEATSPDERDRLLAAALAHVEMQEAIYRVPADSATTRRWKGLIAAGVFVLAVLLAALPPDLLVPARPESLSEADRLRGIRTALLLQAEQIEAFKVREERLPTSLAEVDTALPGIRFVKSSNRLYQLVAHTPDGDAIIFDSAAPDEAFEDIGSPLVPDDAS